MRSVFQDTTRLHENRLWRLVSDTQIIGQLSRQATILDDVDHIYGKIGVLLNETVHLPLCTP